MLVALVGMAGVLLLVIVVNNRRQPSWWDNHHLPRRSRRAGDGSAWAYGGDSEAIQVVTAMAMRAVGIAAGAGVEAETSGS